MKKLLQNLNNSLLVLMILLPFYLTASEHNEPKVWFFPNQGQWEGDFYYCLDLSSKAIFFESDAILFNLHHHDDYDARRKMKFGEIEELPDYIRSHAYRMRFAGASAERRIEGYNKSPHYHNYFRGNNPERWKENVYGSSLITYHDIYDGIDLDVYFKDGLFKYDFRVIAGKDPGQIRINYEDVDRLRIVAGNLQIETNAGNVSELKPVAWNLKDGQKQYVECRFRLRGNTVTFDFPKGYDKNLPLVIDPVLVFSSFSGSTADNWGYTATYDDAGYLYAGGIAFGAGYPTTTGAYQTSFGGGSIDVAISKYDTSGSSLIYSTYLGGNAMEVPSSIVVNSNYQLYILGITGSSNFPVTAGSFDTSFNGGTPYSHSGNNFVSGSDIFISKLSATGGALMASTYVGGSANDGFNSDIHLRKNYADDVRGEIKVDAAGNVYVASTTRSNDFPVTAGSYQTTTDTSSTQDAVVFKMDNNLTTMVWCTYLGGSSSDAAYSLIINENGHVYAAGGTKSPDFPVTPMAFQGTYQGGVDGFISVISSNGQNLLASTFYGTSAYDQIYFIDTDRYGVPYVTGQTLDNTNYFITPNAAWNTPGAGQFITKFHPHLNNRHWSTTYGSGNGIDVSPSAFMVDLCGNIYVSAWGGNPNADGNTYGLPISANAFQTTTDGKDFYFLVIQNDAAAMIYGTFFGGAQPQINSGEHVDGGTSRFDKRGIIYQSVCAGCHNHSNFPTTQGAWSNTNNSSGCNNAVIKFDFKIPLLVADFIVPPVGCAPYNANFVNTSYNGSQAPYSCFWDFGNGQTSTNCNPSNMYTTSGVHNVTLIISSPHSCNQADTVVKQVVVLSNLLDTLPQKNICTGEHSQIGVLPVIDPTVTYNWYPSTGLSSTTASNPIASPVNSTWYHLIMSNGICSDTLIQLVEVHHMDANAGNDTTYCIDNIVLTGKTTSSPALFQWSDNIQFSNWLNTSSNNPSCTIPAGGNNVYYLKVYNQYGCEAIDSVVVSPRVFPLASTSQPVKCHNDCNGSAVSVPAGGAPPYSWQWSSGSNVSTAANLCPGAHTLTVTDNDGCFGIDSIYLENPPPVNPNITPTHVPCSIACIGVLQSNTGGGQPPYSYNWSTGSTNHSINNLCFGTYYLSVTDSRGCTVQDTAVVLDLGANLVIETWQSKDTIFKGQSVDIQTTLLPGHTYSWVPATGLNNPGIHNPTAKPTVTTTYIVTFWDVYGCSYTDTITIVVLEVFCEDPYIYIPNAFTPNNDNINDVFYVRTLYAESAYFAVYNRWGERVFETTDLSRGWDGTFRGNMSQPGVYVYYVEVKCFDGQTFTKKGNVTLIR